MADPPYSIRNYRPADFNFFVLLYREAERQEPIGRPATPQSIMEKLSHPAFSPEHDLFLVEKAGEIIGFMDILPELDIKRLIVDAWLRPEHRRKGLGRKLLKLAVRRAGELGAVVLHVNVSEDNTVAKNVLSRLGFERVRRYLKLGLDLSNSYTRELSNAYGECRHLREGEEAILTQVQKRSFAGQWGYNPDTVATIAYRIGLSHRSPGDTVLACEEDEVIGYCWTEVTSGGDGRIYMIGSDPDHRGRGIGRKLLLAGLAHLKNVGVKDVWLTVDDGNKAALSLYESTGFRLLESYLWYEKSVV